MQDFVSLMASSDFREIEEYNRRSDQNGFNSYELFDIGIVGKYGQLWRVTNQVPIEVRNIIAYNAYPHDPSDGFIQCIVIVALFDDDELQVIAGYFGYLNGEEPESLWYEPQQKPHMVQFDTIAEENFVDGVGDRLANRLEASVREFIIKWRAKNQSNDKDDFISEA